MSQKSQRDKDADLLIEQNLKKYNRESGRKTLIFIGILITVIVIFSILSLYIINKPKIMTSSIDNQDRPAKLQQK